jgi:hypothetical protein
MQVEQISVFLANQAGRLAEVTQILSETGVNIRALFLVDNFDQGVLRMIVNDNKKAEEALKGQGFAVSKTNVVAVKVEDKPGGLHKILDILQKATINVEYMYAFVQQSGINAVMIFRFNHPEEAVKLLTEKGVTVVNGEDVYTL